MRVLVTGATGFIGSRLIEALTGFGYEVNVLVRSPDKLAVRHPENLTIHQGDVLNIEKINQAMKNCNAVFHLAAFAGIWSADKMLPYIINVTGTKNILDAAVHNQVPKVIFTSSAGTLSPSINTELVDENTPLPHTYHTDYEQSKLQAEHLCLEYNARGLDVIIVNPTRVFGPGPLNKSNSVTILIKNYLKGQWRFLPGNGESIGNYAFIDDVVKGHILAMQLGKPGEKYVLGGTNASYNEFFKSLAETSGKSYRLFHLPFSLISAFSEAELFLAKTIGKKPIITPPWANRYRENRLVSSQKAVEHLGYQVTPLPEAFENTIGWLGSS